MGCVNVFSGDGADDILGVWLMANQNVKVAVYQQDSLYYGKVIWMDDDANTKNFSLGGLMIDEMKYNSQNQRYEQGSFYGRGYRLNCALRLMDNDKMEVIVSKGFLKQVRYCTRVNDDQMATCFTSPL